MFAIPAPTDYDVKFRLLGIPVRIHPFFWMMAAALGWESHDRFYVLVWIACVFLSILVHEFGHAMTAERLSRVRPSVYFYLMGGLCVMTGRIEAPGERAAVLIMGPVAGFLLFALVLIAGLSVLGHADFWPVGEISVHPYPSWFKRLPEGISWAVLIAYDDLLWINLFWGLFNLLPIYPLDGGQLASTFLSMRNRREGPSRAHILGILTAGGLAVYYATIALKSNANGPWVTVFFLANLAFMNYQLLQVAQAQRNYGYGAEDDDQWWRR